MVKDGYQAWRELKKPIFSRMPSEIEGSSFQDYIATDWLLNYWDVEFVKSLEKCEDLVRQFNPTLCDPEYLDFLAPLCGWTPPYWDVSYPTESKRVLLSASYYLIWANKGSREVLSYVLNSLGINHRIVTAGSFILGISQVSVNELGTGSWEFEILLPLIYPLDGYEFKVTAKIAHLFAPAWVSYVIRHE
jgi:hypothetical protein